MKHLHTPLCNEDLEGLKSGDKVLLTGDIYTARDAAHARLIKLLEEGQPLPFEIRGQVIYYAGPTPARPGKVIGSAGPTTSYRMDTYTPKLIAEGLKGMIGKGSRSQEVKDAIQMHKAVYFAAVGGAAALISECINAQELVAYEDLGAEAIRRLTVENFPVIVVNDIYGEDLYLEGQRRYSKNDGEVE